MSWSARTLCTIYAAVIFWLAYCTVQTWSHVPLWTSLTMGAAVLIPIVAGRREAEHADDMRTLRVQLERAVRPAPAPVISPAERARFNAIVAGLDMDDAA